MTKLYQWTTRCFSEKLDLLIPQWFSGAGTNPKRVSIVLNSHGLQWRIQSQRVHEVSGYRSLDHPYTFNCQRVVWKAWMCGYVEQGLVLCCVQHLQWKTNFVDLPEVLLQYFKKFTNKSTENEILSLRF